MRKISGWYSLFVGEKCLFFGKASYNAVMSKAFDFSKRRRGADVMVFQGKDLGRYLCKVSSAGMRGGRL